MNYIVRTIDGLEHTLEGVAQLLVNSGAEYVFYDEVDKNKVPFRSPMRSVSAIIDRSQYKGDTKNPNLLEAKINASHVSQKVRDGVLQEAKEHAYRYVVRPIETAQEKKLQIFDTAEIEAHPIEIELPVLPPWPLKTPPKQYLQKSPGGKHASLARALLVPMRALVETIVRLANEEHQRKINMNDPEQPVIIITVRDVGDEPYMTVPTAVFNQMVAQREFQPVMSPVWEKNGRSYRPEQRADGTVVLRPCRMEFDGKVKMSRVNIDVPQDMLKQG